jgi:hypothetical protein
LSIAKQLREKERCRNSPEKTLQVISTWPPESETPTCEREREREREVEFEEWDIKTRLKS